MIGWWKYLSHAAREAVMLVALAIVGICIVVLTNATVSQQSQYGNLLLTQNNSYRIECALGHYSLLFAQQIPLLGNDQFQAIGRLKKTEARDILEALQTTHLVRHFGYRQLDDNEKKSYGFDNAVRISSPGQQTWTIGSGLDGYGYALDEDNNLYQLDHDLAIHVNRTPEALRSSSFDIPQHIQQIDFQAEWSLLRAYDLWWIQEADSARPAEQSACADWLQVLTQSRAVSFTSIKEQQSSPFIRIQGKDMNGRRDIGIFDRGPARGSQVHRIIERKEHIGDRMLIESFIMSIDPSYILLPQSALASTKMFPIPFDQADALVINKLSLQHHQARWYLRQVNNGVPTDILADQEQVTRFLEQLQRLPAGKTLGEIIGHMRIAEAEIDIRTSPELKAHAHYHNYMFVDKRLFPIADAVGSGTSISGLVIQATDAVPAIYSQADDGSWDVDEETNEDTKDFIAALSAARVKKWDAAYQSQTRWTSTLTVAIGDARIIIHKNDDGLIGIPARNVQGYLDRDSAEDLFGN